MRSKSGIRRWIVYVARDERAISRFGRMVAKAGKHWKPVAVDPLNVDEAVKVLKPELIVVARRQPRGDSLLRRILALHGRRRLVMDDRQLAVVSRLLAAAA